MTYKNGFYIGLGVGFVIWLITEGILAFTPNPEMAKNSATVIFILFTAVSIILGITWVFTGHASPLKTTGDGFFYGFTTVFDILYFAIPILHGQIPAHLVSIFFIIL
jgi:hypothetical protein